MYVIKRVKILLVVTLSEVGVAQKVVYHIVAGLEPGLFDVTVVCAPGGEIYFLLVGDGPLRSRCEGFIKDKGLGDRIFLMGTREDVPVLIQDFDIFVLFSRWEGMPLTIIEAMLAGVPVVANDVGGVSELVERRETGYLLKNLDLDEAENAIRNLVFDSDERLLMGKRGRQRAESMFNVNKMVDKYRKLYLS